LVCGAILIGLYALFTPTPKPAVAANETASSVSEAEDKAEN
jgi:hypothetical protein